MSHAALAAVLRLDDVSAGERLAAFSLASFANREHRAWPGTPVAAARAGLSRSQYLAARDGLARRGLIEVDAPGGGRGRTPVVLVETSVPDLRILGVLIAASDQRWRIARDATSRMSADQMRVLPIQIPRAVRVASAPRCGAPTVVLEPDSMVSHAYRQLADHILGELGR